ncbi:MAG: phosphatidylserine decarboxylase family protein [Thermodesulfobacteriota bacterium]
MDKASDRRNRRIHNRLAVAREGLPFIGAGVVLTFVLAGLNLGGAATAAGILTLFVVYFFRDPERRPVCPEQAVLAPADGRILGVQELPGTDNPLGQPAVKVSIFMSVFNVHVNRIPATGLVSGITYRPGRFLSANLDKASEQNEHNRIILQTHSGARLAVVQIAGLIARRIACWIREGDEVLAGQRFGLIRFGSRVDVYLPRRARTVVEKSQKVRAGQTILGYLS